jgi:glycosyltransferase involved in cell wall biosynthesis
MDPSQPLVTAIVPAFNSEAWIGATLDSVAAQTWPNLEILIVDDGSTDGTAAIAAAFCAGEPRARLIRKPNQGVAAARNRGIEEAKGEWIAPIDSDDLWHPTKIEKQVKAALEAPERPGFVYCWSRTIDGDGRVTGAGPAHPARGWALRRLAYYNLVSGGSVPLLNARAVRDAGGYDEGLEAARAWGGEDNLLQMEIAARHPIAAVEEYLVGYRVRAGAMSSDGERMYRSWTIAMRRFGERQGAVPGTALRWNGARRRFGLAEARAIRGDRAGMAAMLARALWDDPIGIGALIGYRIARLFGRVLGRAPGAPHRPAFAACATVGAIGGDVHAIGRLQGWLAAIERRRLRRLGTEEHPPSP